MTTTHYNTNQAAAMLGITPGRLREIAYTGRAGHRTVDGWRFTDEDIARLRNRRPGRPSDTDVRVRDFLTISPQEAQLIVAALNGHTRTPGVSDRDELLLSILDSVGPDAEGERLDEQYGVTDWRSLIVRIAALTDAQAGMVFDAAERFWASDHERGTDELLSEVGLL